MPKEEDIVSIIIPVFNCESYIEKALFSVQSQYYRPLELIVVDDGSTDKTLALLEQWESQNKVDPSFSCRIYSQKHKGGSAARNLGISKASGQLVQFLDADDTMSPYKIVKQVEALHHRTNTVVYCSWRYIYDGDQKIIKGEIRQTHSLDAECDVLKAHIEGWFCPIHSYLWPKICLEEIGGFDESLSADQDGDLMLRGLISGFRLKFTPDIEVQYRLHASDQISQSTTRSRLRSRLRVVLKMFELLEKKSQIDTYRESLALRCDDLERASCLTYPPFSRLCRKVALRISPGHDRLVRGGFLYRLSRQLFGFYLSEWLASKKRVLFNNWRR